MRIETKIALGFYAILMFLNFLIILPEFIEGFFMGIALVFFIIGLLPTSVYARLKEQQKNKIVYIKHLFHIN